jgi:hypothetical protein
MDASKAKKEASKIKIPICPVICVHRFFQPIEIYRMNGSIVNGFLLDIFAAALYGKYNEFHANNPF